MDSSSYQITDQLIPLQQQIKVIKSTVDSFNFELGEYVIKCNTKNMDICSKKFKHQIEKQLSMLGKGFLDFETKFSNGNLIKLVKQKEFEIGVLDKLKSSNEDKILFLSAQLKEMEKDSMILKERLDQCNKEICMKDEELMISQNKLMEFEMEFCNGKKNIEQVLSKVEMEKKTLQEKLNMKDNYINSKLTEKEQTNREMQSMKMEINETMNNFKEKEALLDKQKKDVNLLENLVKIDRKNLIDNKKQIKEMDEKLKDHEFQLHVDYELISKLKSELKIQQNQNQQLITEKKQAFGQFYEQKKKCQIFEKEIEKLRNTAQELDELLMTLTETNLRIAGKYKKSKALLHERTQQLTSMKQDNEIMEKQLTNARDQHEKDKQNLEKLEKQLREIDKVNKKLNLTKSINDEKINLLQKFVDDIGRNQKDESVILAQQNATIKSKIDKMKTAYENCFLTK